jgi:hypothetical protein
LFPFSPPHLFRISGTLGIAHYEVLDHHPIRLK